MTYRHPFANPDNSFARIASVNFDGPNNPYGDLHSFAPMSSQSTFFYERTRSQTPRHDFLDLRIRQDFVSDEFGFGWRRTLKVSVLAGSRLFALKRVRVRCRRGLRQLRNIFEVRRK